MLSPPLTRHAGLTGITVDSMFTVAWSRAGQRLGSQAPGAMGSSGVEQDRERTGGEVEYVGVDGTPGDESGSFLRWFAGRPA